MFRITVSFCRGGAAPRRPVCEESVFSVSLRRQQSCLHLRVTSLAALRQFTFWQSVLPLVIFAKNLKVDSKILIDKYWAGWYNEPK